MSEQSDLQQLMLQEWMRNHNAYCIFKSAMLLAIAACGNPDPAEGCRVAIRVLRDALKEFE